MQKNELIDERNQLLRKYHSFNGALARALIVLLVMCPFFYMVFVPLPQGVSIHLLFFMQAILLLLIVVASQINWKLDLILKIYNLDKQEYSETVDPKSKK